jgi:hypothetical protein
MNHINVHYRQAKISIPLKIWSYHEISGKTKTALLCGRENIKRCIKPGFHD